MSVLLLLFGVYGFFFHTFCSSDPVGLLLSILLCSSKVDGMIVFHISHILQLILKQQLQGLQVPCVAMDLTPGKSGCVNGSWYSISFAQEVVMEMQSLKTAVLSFCDCISMDRLPQRWPRGLGWRGARQLVKMLQHICTWQLGCV